MIETDNKHETASDGTRILGLDYGSKRVGVAVSDEMQMIAQPLEFIPAEPRSKLLHRVAEIIDEKRVACVVIGLPRNMDGTYGAAAESVRAFIEVLRGSVTLPIETWDERLTTVQANRDLIAANVRRRDRKGRVDKTAAAILLQSYLDRGQC